MSNLKLCDTFLEMNVGSEKPEYPMRDELSEEDIERGARKLRNILRHLYLVAEKDCDNVSENLTESDCQYSVTFSDRLYDYLDDESEKLLNVLESVALIEKLGELRKRDFKNNDTSAQQLAFMIFARLTVAAASEFPIVTAEALTYLTEWIQPENPLQDK